MPPVAIAAPAIGLSLAGSVVGALGAAQSGAQEAAMSRYQAGVAQLNSQVAQQNAQQAIAAGSAQANQAGMEGAQRLGAIRTAQGANNLDVNSGSNANVQKSQAEINALTQLVIKNNAARAAYGYQVQGAGFQAQSQLENLQATNAQQAGKIGVFNSLLGGASSLSTKFLGANQTGLFGLGGGSGGGPASVPGGDQLLG